MPHSPEGQGQFSGALTYALPCLSILDEVAATLTASSPMGNGCAF